MTPERINEIFKGIRELVEWQKNVDIRNIARKNGKSILTYKFCENLIVIKTALESAETCNICAMQGTQKCNSCVLGRRTISNFTPINGQCAVCGQIGTVGENLLFHFTNEDKKEILCSACHIKAHERSTGQ